MEHNYIIIFKLRNYLITILNPLDVNLHLSNSFIIFLNFSVIDSLSVLLLIFKAFVIILIRTKIFISYIRSNKII
jgi:hypothetical protein